jgi:radical SAM protein with 4Fe4S-binding SPASM domain
MIPKVMNAIRTISTRNMSMELDQIPFEYQYVPLKKLLNRIMIEAGIHYKSKKPWGYPTHLHIEPSTLCNLKCAFCPVTTGMERPTGLMTHDVFKKTIDELADYLFMILLWDWGEPFLNPEVYDMIFYAKQKDIKIISSTNGHVFAQPGNADKLVRSGIDAIIFAVDGISQETYERFRKNGNLKMAIQGLENVVAAKRALNSRTPLINFRFIPMKHNEHEIPHLKDFAHSFGVDMFTIKSLNPHDQREVNANMANGLAFMPQDPRYQRFAYDEKGSRIRLAQNPCKRPWMNPSIHWDGKVSLCTFDAQDHYVMGDLNKESFKEIWWGRDYTSFRRQFRHDYRSLPFCDGCTNAFKGGNLGTDTIIEGHFFDDDSKGKVVTKIKPDCMEN